jgi:hypothetical protein
MPKFDQLTTLLHKTCKSPFFFFCAQKKLGSQQKVAYVPLEWTDSETQFVIQTSCQWLKTRSLHSPHHQHWMIQSPTVIKTITYN